ncbi:GDP-mannose 4,6-dehydratase [Paenibacillus qinlingensis]|uniref:CDP-glucose 4,6-dehydratase n=1 Tax=Paenibacillus qinlingensis TaxID=1837343 RepID=A0ABU1NTA2_9BACL|nr:GDP-mannose 4,6-dehydratase [Paenibacillus qinlingensis]MDR6550713.1 CDP-glucose 4,6-dehydratase [Paenibacillus qinlingensis]
MKPFWKDRNVFITGCTGFLGRHLIKELIKSGAHITGLVRGNVQDSVTSTFQEELFSKINLVHGSLKDLSIIQEALENNRIDTVFHVAAQSIAGTANRNPIQTFETNIQGTWNVLESCRQHPVKRIIIASSEKSYGEHASLPLDESFPLQGRHPYDVSKSCGDLITQAYFYTYQLPVCIARFGNVFGGGDLNFNRIIPHTISSVIHHVSPVIRSDGTLVRDYLYVEDAVHAMMRLAEKMEESGITGEAFNFSNENPFSVSHVVTSILNGMDSDLQPIVLNVASNETQRQYLSAQKARELLGWQPIFDWDTGLVRTIDWYKKYFTNLGDLSE